MFTLTTPSSPTSESTTLALAADRGVAGTCSGPPPAPPPPCSVAVPSWQSVACVGETLWLQAMTPASSSARHLGTARPTLANHLLGPRWLWVHRPSSTTATLA